MLEEKKAPVGHVLVETPWFFNVDVTGVAHLEAEYTMASSAWHTNSFFIENKPGASLPHTGGHGTRIFTILGAILIAGAGLLLLRRRRAI
jgi:LPXTG-motif cell wall-anchored protein